MSQLLVDDIVDKDGGNSVGFSKGINVSASSTITGNLNVTGVLTYEDVTNVDSVGVITAQSGIKLGAAGIGGTIAANGDTTLAGVVTATTFSATDSITATGGIKFGAAGVGGTIAANGNTTLAGVVTANSFVGDGSGLTNLVGTGVTNNVNTVNLNVISGVSTFNNNVTLAAGNLNVDAGQLLVGSGITIGPAGVATFADGSTTANSLKFGNEGDLSLYHDGSTSNIVNTSGTINVGTNNFVVKRQGLDETMLYAQANNSVWLYYDNSTKLQTLSTGVKVTGVTSTTSLSVGPGVLQEKLYNVASALTGTVNFDVVTNGLVQYYTTNSSGTFIVNLRGDGSTTFNSLMDIGKTTVFTVYSAQNNASYYMTDFKIDGSSITEKWNGGSAPSAGTASGTDVYTFNIMKTADATFTVFATFSNFA